MSDPTSIPTAPEQPTPLNYAVGSPDPQSGGVRPLGLILTLLGGLAAAVVAALVAFFWIIFRLPSPFFAPLIVQGLLVGGALFWLFKRFRLRGSAVGLLLGIICGLASPLSFQYGLYVRNVYHVHTTTVRGIEDARRMGNLSINVAYADWLEQHPFVAFDRLVLRPHGLHGFIGYLRLRGHRTATFGFIQAVVVASLATFMGRKAATRRVCVQCQNWLGDAIEVAALPAALTEALVVAIQSDDAHQVMALHHPAQRFGGGVAIARLHFCAKCSLRHVDVITKTSAGSAPQLGLTLVSKDTLNALRFEFTDVKVQPELPGQVAPGDGLSQIPKE